MVLEMNCANTTLRSLVLCVLTQIHINRSLPVGFKHPQFQSQTRYRLSNPGVRADSVTAPPKMFLGVNKPRPTAAVLSFARTYHSQPKPEKQRNVIFHSAVGPARSFVSYRNHYSENRNSFSGLDITKSHSPSQKENSDPQFQQQQDRYNRVISSSEYVQPLTNNDKQEVNQNGNDRYQIKSMEWYGPKPKVDKSAQKQNLNQLGLQNAQYDQNYDQHKHVARDSSPGSQSSHLNNDNYDLQQPTEMGQNYDSSQQQSVSELFPYQQPNENFQTFRVEPSVNTPSDKLKNPQSAANQHQNIDQRLSHINGNTEIKPTSDNGPVIYSHREALKQLKNRNVNEYIKSVRNAAKHDILNKNINGEQHVNPLERGIPNSVSHLAKVLAWSPYISLASVKKEPGYGKPQMGQINNKRVNNQYQQKDPSQNQRHPTADNYFSQSSSKRSSQESTNGYGSQLTTQNYNIKNQNVKTGRKSFSSTNPNNNQEQSPEVSQYSGPRTPGAVVKAIVDPYELRRLLGINMNMYSQ